MTSPAAPHFSAHEEHELPSVEAVLAGTLALMTGYCQALQADLNPGQRVVMGHKIGRNLELLAQSGGLSEAFQRIALGLQARWQLMAACTAEACGLAEPPAPTCRAPSRLQ